MKGFIYLLFCWVFVQANAQTQIAGYEYWFNNNFEARVQAITQPVEQFSLNLNAPTPGLSTGIHVFNIRFLDTEGFFGNPLCQLFFKSPESGSIERQIVEYEYWIDGNFDNSNSILIQSQTQFDLSGFIDLSSIYTGIHSFNLRFRDNSNLWSVPVTQFFYASPLSVSENRQIIAYQYWIDNNYSDVFLINTPVQQIVMLDQSLDLQQVSTGIHSFNIRFMDNAGIWSSPLSQFFYKLPQLQSENNLVMAYRYWLDDNWEEPDLVFLDEPVENFVLIDNIDFTRIPKGEHSVQFQFQDAWGLWSSPTSDYITKIPLPIADFDYSVENFCDSTRISFIDKSIDGDEYLWDFGDGNSSTEAEPSHMYYFEGNYQVSLTVTDTTLKIDSTLVVNILVNINAADASVTQNGYILTANADNAEYRWLDCNNNLTPIPNETNKTFTATANGIYSVEVTQNGCTKISECFVVTNVGVVQLQDVLQIKVFPNPTSGLINIDLGKHFSNFKIIVTDLSGRLVGEFKYDFGREVSFNLDAPPGFYMLNLQTNDQKTTKVVIRL